MAPTDHTGGCSKHRWTLLPLVLVPPPLLVSALVPPPLLVPLLLPLPLLVPVLPPLLLPGTQAG